MNILASYKWLGEFVDLKGVTPEALASSVSLASSGIERLYPQGLDLERVVVGRTVSVEKHLNADALKLVQVDVGGSKPLSIVCGGSNVVEGQWVPVAQIGARVRWHGEGELVELKPVAIRGIASEGMICAANEIGLFDAFPHGEKEILDLGEAGFRDVKPGTPLADLLDLSGDTLMDTEITTNRPDCLGMVGLAREVATILDKKFFWKETRLSSSRTRGSTGWVDSRFHGNDRVEGRIKVVIHDKALCSRFTCARIDNVRVGPSPWWIKKRLIAEGLRSVNNVVDITNYVMLELGHPMHVYDAERISGQEIHVRRAKEGETLPALDGVTYELPSTALVIANREQPMAIAGIMGGEYSSVGSGTVSVVFESATFDPVSVRRTSRALHLQTDAQLRFEKGLSTKAPEFALARAIELCLEIAGGELKGITDVQPKPYKTLSFSTTFKEINGLLGVNVPEKESVRILKALGFGVKKTAKGVTAQVPWWRDHDIEAGRDLIEEVARVYGYTNIPAVFPVGAPALPVSKELTWEKRLRHVAVNAGFTEVFTYSFVSDALLARAGFSSSKMMRIQNPLSQEFEFMRTSLLPSILQVVEENKDKRDTLKLFECAHVYYPVEGDLPKEQMEFGGCVFTKDDSAWRVMKGFAEHLFANIGWQNVEWKPLTTDAFWHPGRSMQAFVGEHLLATLGEIQPNIAKAFGVTRDIGRIAMMDIPLEIVTLWAKTSRTNEPLPKFPDVERDLAVLVDRDVTSAMIQEALKQGSYRSALRSVEWFDTYRGKGVPEGKKSVAFHLVFRNAERTLSSEEVDAWMNEAKKILAETYRAEQRS